MRAEEHRTKKVLWQLKSDPNHLLLLISDLRRAAYSYANGSHALSGHACPMYTTVESLLFLCNYLLSLQARCGSDMYT